MKHTHFFGNAETVFQKEKRFCAFQAKLDHFTFKESIGEGVKKQFADIHAKVKEKQEREDAATKAVQQAVQTSIEGMGRFSERVKATLMFKDQTSRIEDAAKKMAQESNAWFIARKEELGENFDTESAYALALQEVRDEMLKQTQELIEKQQKTKKIFETMKGNLQWYSYINGGYFAIRHREKKAERAEERATAAKNILTAQIEKQNTRFENIRSVRKQFTEITGMTEEQLTRIIQRVEKDKNGNTVTLDSFIQQQPKEVRSSLKRIRNLLTKDEGEYFNQIEYAKSLLEQIKDKKAVCEQITKLKEGEFIEFTMKDSKVKYKVSSIRGDKMVLFPTHDQTKLPVLTYDKKTNNLDQSGFYSSLNKGIIKASRAAANFKNNVQEAVKAGVNTAETLTEGIESNGSGI